VGGITPALAIAAVCAEKGATVLAGVATTDFSFNIARALALSPRFAGTVDVGGPALSALPAGSMARTTDGLGKDCTPIAGGGLEFIADHIL
jgi:L-alanine-DL-glutamate epimerase-like enolase superfamily enzyme